MGLNVHTVYLSLVFIFLLLPVSSRGVPDVYGSPSPPRLESLTLDQFVGFSNRDLQHTLGVDLNWKQKIALNSIRRKAKRHLRKYPEAQCQPLGAFLGPQDEPIIERLSLLSFLLGVTSPLLIFLAFAPVGFAFGALAIVFGILGLSKRKKDPDHYTKSSRAFAITGIVLGALLVGLFLVIVISFAT